MRRIETEAGIIAGSVDRALRQVVWHLECPDCGTPIPFTADSFAGRAPMRCECGWKTRPIGHKERSENGSVHEYFNYEALAFGDSTGCSSGSEIGGIHTGMRF